MRRFSKRKEKDFGCQIKMGKMVLVGRPHSNKELHSLRTGKSLQRGQKVNRTYSCTFKKMIFNWKFLFLLEKSALFAIGLFFFWETSARSNRFLGIIVFLSGEKWQWWAQKFGINCGSFEQNCAAIWPFWKHLYFSVPQSIVSFYRKSFVFNIFHRGQLWDQKLVGNCRGTPANYISILL